MRSAQRRQTSAATPDSAFGDVARASLAVDSKGLIGTDGRFKKSTASRAADSSLKAPVESNTLDACSS